MVVITVKCLLLCLNGKQDYTKSVDVKLKQKNSHFITTLYDFVTLIQVIHKMFLSALFIRHSKKNTYLLCGDSLQKIEKMKNGVLRCVLCCQKRKKTNEEVDVGESSWFGCRESADCVCQSRLMHLNVIPEADTSESEGENITDRISLSVLY